MVPMISCCDLYICYPFLSKQAKKVMSLSLMRKIIKTCGPRVPANQTKHKILSLKSFNAVWMKFTGRTSMKTALGYLKTAQKTVQTSKNAEK